MSHTYIKNCKAQEPYSEMRAIMCEVESGLKSIDKLNKKANKLKIYEYTLWSPYDFETKIESTKKGIMQKVARMEIAKISPNIKVEKIDINEMEPIYSQLDFKDLLKKIDTKYGANREEIAFKQLLESAQKMRPWERGRVIPRHKNKLTLEGGSEDNMRDLRKLTSVVIDNVNPSKAEIDYNTNKVIDWKFFKNRRTDVKFDSPETAEKMRKVLKLL